MNCVVNVCSKTGEGKTSVHIAHDPGAVYASQRLGSPKYSDL